MPASVPTGLSPPRPEDSWGACTVRQQAVRPQQAGLWSSSHGQGLISDFGLWLLLHQGPLHSCGQQGVTWALFLVISHACPQFEYQDVIIHYLYK